MKTYDNVAGNDRLTITVPVGTPAGSAPIAVTRADGVQAKTTADLTILAFTVLEAPK